MEKVKSFIFACMEFLSKNIRYVISSGLLIFIVLIMVSSDDKKIRVFPEIKIKREAPKKIEKEKTEIANEDETETENLLILNEDKELNKFIKGYYKAVEKADIEKIRKYVDVLSDAEASSIKQKARSREAHKNIKVYTKRGPEDDSFLVYVYLDLKFKNIKTMAPGIEPYYVKKESDGYVIINSMNSSVEDLQYTNEMEASEDIVELYAKADEAYREACAKDKELVNMLKENGLEVPDLSEEKKDEEKKDTEGETIEQTEVKPEKSDIDKQDKKDEIKVAEKADKKDKKKKKSKGIVGKTYILTDGIRLREKKSTNSQIKASGVKEDRVIVLKEYKKSKWVKVQLIAAGKSFYGYMKKDVLLSNSKLKK